MTNKGSVDQLLSKVAVLQTPQGNKECNHESSNETPQRMFVPDNLSTPCITTTTRCEPAKNVAPPSPFAHLSNTCSADAGAQILFATDEWFATADNLLKNGPPLFFDDLFCEQGKVMDGWETRRRREAGHDFCIIKLSERAQICAVELDTAHFTGNNVMHTSLQIADLSPCQETTFVSNMPGVLERLLNKGLGVQGTGHTPEEVLQAEQASTNVQWTELLAYSPLQPGYEESRMHYFTLPSPKVGTHVRVNYYPDGGVARLRLYSSLTTTVLRTPTTIEKPLYAPISTGKTCTVVAHSSTDSPPSRDGTYPYPELSGADNGGIGLACSNKHYGEPSQLLQSSLGKDMGDGWETARHPERPSILVRDPKTNLVASPLKDWSIIKLRSIASSGITRIIVDTRHFRGNYPESVTCEGCFAERGITDEMVMSGTSSALVEWFPLILRTRMSPDSEHIFDSNLEQIVNASRAVTHVRVSIYPDGGLSRVRIYGESNDKDHHDGDMPCKL